jgi:hypothetical protein
MGGSFYTDPLLAAADWKGMAAFAAAVGGPLIGLAGVSFAWLNGKSERAHETREARIQRVWAFREETYLATSRYLERLAAWLDRTDPVIAPSPIRRT